MKQLTEAQKIQQAFYFVYAGVCTVWITITRKKFQVVCTGYTVDSDNIVFFNRLSKFRLKCDSLYDAISQFNYQCFLLTQSMDWFTPDFFIDDDNFRKIYNKYVY